MEEKRSTDLLCKEKHERINEKLDTHNSWLKDHERKIDTLTKSDAENGVSIKNLCEQLKDLVTTIKWLIGMLLTSMIGFFIWAVQKGM